MHEQFFSKIKRITSFYLFLFFKIRQDLITVYLQKMSNEAKRAFSNVIAQNGKNL